MVFLWLLAGSLLVSVPFYLFYDPYNLWPSVFAGGIGAAVYLLSLLTSIIRSNRPIKFKMIVTFSCMLFLATGTFGAKTMYDMTHYQRATLTKIRTVIADGIFLAEDINDRALPVFSQYHKQSGSKKGVVTLFKNIHGNKMVNGMFPTDYPEQDAGKRYVRFFGDTMVVLVSVDTVARGANSEFANLNGSVGKLQSTTTLTAKGVNYERNN